jgi:hypothetical protein
MALSRTLWQIGTGDGNRPYGDEMIARGVAMLGPGSLGRWEEGHPAYHSEPEVRRFAQTADSRDLVVARHGVSKALAVGVLGEYDHCEAFDDIEGWDLQHYRRVRWLDHEGKHFYRKPFSRNRFCQCHNHEVREWVEGLLAGDDLHAPGEGDDLPALPVPKEDLARESLDEGLAEILRLASWWHGETWGGGLNAWPSEDELLTHVTVPLLEALGWEPEQIAVKWEFTDLALFTPARRDSANCRLVVEGKRIGHGLSLATTRQGRTYVDKLELQGADVLVTDGIRYRLYRRPDFLDNDDVPYANLDRPKASAERLFDALRRP